MMKIIKRWYGMQLFLPSFLFSVMVSDEIVTVGL